jgi:hypothetical protein
VLCMCYWDRCHDSGHVGHIGHFMKFRFAHFDLLHANGQIDRHLKLIVTFFNSSLVISVRLPKLSIFCFERA